MTNMIETRKLVKHFDELAALAGVSINVPRGAVYGLVGPNGAGKSTLISHLTGAMRQDSGEVLVCGEPVFENVAVKSRVACIPSNFYYHQNASINDMADLYASMYPSFSVERFAALGGEFELDPKRPIRKFSKGMKKQAAFWLNLAVCPDVMLLDEPMDGLDPLMRRKAWSLVLNEVAEREMTVLVSSHNLRELEGVCSHMGIMHKGSMLHEYDLAQTSDGMLKVQVAFPDGVPTPATLDIVSERADGRLKTMIIRGDASEVSSILRAADPVLLEIVPLSLEELFLCELGGVSDEIKELVL